MRRILVLVFVLLSIQGFAQPSNYSWYKQRTRQYSFMADSAMYLPRYNGTPSGVRSNESSTISGMVGIDTTNHRQYFRSGSSWRRLANYTELGVDSIWRVAGTDSIYYSKQGTTYKIKDSTGGSSSVPLSSLTAATGSNTIDNGDYKQRWQWNTLSGANGLSIESTSTDALGSVQELVGIRLSGANSQPAQTTKSLYISNTHTGSASENYAVDIVVDGASSANLGMRIAATGAASNNYGLFVSASGGTNNYSIIAPLGNVGIGTSTPSELLSLGSSGSVKGVISFAGNTSGKVIIQPASAAGTYTLTLPTTDGNSGEFLQTNGSSVFFDY